MPRICIIEDDESLRDELARHLDLQGYECVCIDDFGNAARHVVEADPDCAVLDLKLPETNGLEVCRDVKRSSDIPVIILTSSDSEFDEVMGMNLGADGYLSKPYRPAVLIAHIEAVIRRASGKASSSQALSHGGVVLDAAKGTVTYEGRSCDLTRNEIRILGLLMRSAGDAISRQEIMRELWESDEFVDDNTLTVNVNRLRKDLSAIGVPESFLQTRRGHGYLVR